jgi:hypothetical protein
MSARIISQQLWQVKNCLGSILNGWPLYGMKKNSLIFINSSRQQGCRMYCINTLLNCNLQFHF